jgi:nucleoside-diphosphate-sugar epimerase
MPSAACARWRSRLPQVHGGEGKAGLITYLLEGARAERRLPLCRRRRARWAAAHRLDVARLYRLALEKGVADGIYHAVAEEGVPMREIIEVLGRAERCRWSRSSRKKPATITARSRCSPVLDMPASSALTQKWLGWKPRRDRPDRRHRPEGLFRRNGVRRQRLRHSFLVDA